MTPIVLAVATALTAVCTSGAVPQTDVTQPRVYRFDGVEEAVKDGNRFMALWALDPMSRYSPGLYLVRYRIPIPASDGRLGLPPDERLMKNIAGLKKGDLVDVYTSPSNALARIDRYAVIPGEDMPDSLVFMRLTTTKVKDVTFPAVTLRKFRRENTYPLARKDETGKWLPDQSLPAKLAAFREGDLVKVALLSEEPNVIRRGMQFFVSDVIPYKAPQVGKVVAVHKGAEGKPALVELLAEGKEKPDIYNYKGLETLEVGQQIWFRVTTTDGNTYLEFVWWKKD